MTDRPAAKDERVRDRDGHSTIWVPPGARLVTSENVRVVPMGEPLPPARAAGERRPSKKRTKVDSSPAARVRAPEQEKQASPSPGGRWQTPANWSDLAGPPKENWSDDPASLSVPPEIDAMAQVVMGHYKMNVSGMKLITTKPDKGGAIWRIETDKGPRSLKLLHRDAPRSLFSIGAQDYLVKRGARVPALVRTKGGDMCVTVDGKMWIVTDWIEPLTPASKVDLAGAQALCYGLGEFHRLSQGYVPPEGAYHASRLRRWPKAYAKVLTKMGWFRDLAKAYSEAPAAPVILELVDTFEQQARDALTRLERSAYAELVERGEPAWGIVHQDERLKREKEFGTIVSRKGS